MNCIFLIRTENRVFWLICTKDMCMAHFQRLRSDVFLMKIIWTITWCVFFESGSLQALSLYSNRAESVIGMSLKPAFMEHGLNGPGVGGGKTNLH